VRLDEPLEQPGFFWLPDQRDDKFSGTLRIEQSGRIDLELFGETDIERKDPPSTGLDPSHWSTFQHPDPYARIHGLIEGRAVTLDDCISVSGNRRLSGGVSQSTLSASRAYLGAWYDIDEAPTFSRLLLSMQGLHEWLLLSGLDSQTEHDNGQIRRITHTFEPPSEISVTLPDGTELAFGLSWSETGIGPDATEATIRQRARMSIRCSSPISLDAHLSTSLRFQRLLSLATDQSVDLISLTGFSPEFKRDSHEIPVDIYLHSGRFEQDTRLLRWFRMLFTYPEVADRFQEMIETWYNRYDTVGSAINLHDGLASGGYRYVEGRFLATVQAIEAFHRYSHADQRVMPDEEFDSLVENAIGSVQEERQQWLRQRLQHANEPSLYKRLDDLIEPFHSSFGAKRERRRFVGSIVDTRNSFVHTAVATGNLADDPASLFRLQQKLEALFQLHMLKLLAFSDEEIEKIAQKENIARKLR